MNEDEKTKLREQQEAILDMMERRYVALDALIRPLADQEKRTRGENIAMTHLETAALWLASDIGAARIQLMKNAPAKKPVSLIEASKPFMGPRST